MYVKNPSLIEQDVSIVNLWFQWNRELNMPNIPAFLLLHFDAQLLDSNGVDVTELARVQCFFIYSPPPTRTLNLVICNSFHY